MNVVNVTGNLTKDPEMGQTGSGQEVCRLRVGLGRGRHNHSVYADVKVFGTEARRCSRYLAKGRAVAISGWLEFAEWIGRDGVKRSRLYVGTTNVDFLGSLTAASVVNGAGANGNGSGAFASHDLDEGGDVERFEDFDDQEAAGDVEELKPGEDLVEIEELPDLDEQAGFSLDLQLPS